MALRVVLDNLDSLDPSLHEHYTEKDGKFYLDIEDDVRRHPKGVALTTALDRIKSEKKDLVDKLAEVEARLAELPDDFDPEKYAEAMDELEELRKNKKGDPDPDDEKNRQSQKRLYEQRIANLEAKHTNEKQALLDEKQELEAQIERLMGNEGLTKELVAAGVDKKLLPGATALLRRSVKVQRDPDTKEWRSFVETDVGESTLGEFVANWAQSDEGSIYLSKPNGGGAPGGDAIRVGENPWDTSNGRKANLTKQQELIQTNPSRARQLAQAAGVEPNW